MPYQQIQFTVKGVPVAKGRPKFSTRGGFARAYTPKKTREAEEDFLEQALHSKPAEPILGAVMLKVDFHYVKPKSRKKFHFWTTKPDLDNLVKLVKDSLNGVFWKDDSQIINISARKVYGSSNKTEVMIEELDE